MIHQFKAGDVFNERYILEKLIGVGGFADVWKAKDMYGKKNATIALKIYTRLDEDGINTLAEEYDRMKNISHPNLLKADHFDRWENIPYLEMKFCAGGSLDKRIGKIDSAEAMAIIRDLAEGLRFLHQNDIIHQDIKPANVLIDDKGRYMLSDFGISSKSKTKLSKSVNAATNNTSMTEDYAPPEKFSPKAEDRKPDRKGDIFSFGISMYELITGSLPFDNFATGRQLQYENVEIDFSEIKDEKIRRIIMLCMQRNRDERPSAADIVNYLNSSIAPPAPRKTQNYPLKGYEDKKSGDHIEDSKSKGNQEDDKKKWIWGVIIGAVAVLLIVWILLPASSSSPPEAETITANGVSFIMVRVPGGTFTMGSPSSDLSGDSNERPAHSVTLSDYYIGKYEVTQRLWDAVMGSNPSTTKGYDYPVHNVSWQDCQLFIQKLKQITGRNFSLPTEEQWEFAARYNPKTKELTKFSGGDNAGLCAWYSSNSDGKIHAIGTKNPNARGIYDMSGNVIEWCSDLYTTYGSGIPELGDNERVLRGGYYGSDVASIRAASRGSCQYSVKQPCFGLRLCMQ